MESRKLILAILFAALASLHAMAEGNGAAADAAEEQARNAYIERFTKFTEDKNVMGRPKAPKGAKASGGKKTRFNQDDGVAYQSDLTYHDLSFNTIETEKGDKNDKNDKSAKVSRLFSFVSPHGGISAAGGSSLLERTAYQLHKQFTKAETEEKDKKDDEEKGIKYRSIFKIETQEVAKDDKGGAGGGDAKDGKNDKKAAEPDKVERAELREEVRPQIEKVGEGSFETIRQAGRDKGNENDDTTMPNGVLLRYAAGEASQAMWNSTLSNLVQRRVNRGIKAGAFPDTPQLSESVPNCQNWQQAANSVLNNVKDGEQRKQLQQEIQRMSQQCGQLAAMPYNTVNPRFEANEKTGKDEMKVDGPAKEDGFIRDSRVQLEILSKAGKTTKEVPSNWKYEGKDDKAKITIDFDDGRPKGEQDMTVKAQLESYNKQLQAASEGYTAVQSRMPDIKLDAQAPLQYQIQPNTRSVMDINQPSANLLEDLGVELKNPNPAKNYTDLLQQNSK